MKIGCKAWKRSNHHLHHLLLRKRSSWSLHLSLLQHRHDFELSRRFSHCYTCSPQSTHTSYVRAISYTVYNLIHCIVSGLYVQKSFFFPANFSEKSCLILGPYWIWPTFYHFLYIYFHILQKKYSLRPPIGGRGVRTHS